MSACETFLPEEGLNLGATLLFSDSSANLFLRAIYQASLPTVSIHLESCDSCAAYGQQERLGLLGICQRTIRVQRTYRSLHFQRSRHYPLNPLTIGEHLRKKRIDLALSMTQLTKQLGLGITDTAIEKWEKNQNRPTEPHRSGIVEFLGFGVENLSILVASAAP